MTKHITLFLAIITLSLKVSAYNPEDYACPKDIKETLDAHKNKIRRHRDEGQSFLPGFYIKDHHDRKGNRIEGLEHCKKIIEKYPDKLNLIKLPRKYLYQHPDTQRTYTISTACKNDYHRELNLNQTQQLVYFILKAGWSDGYSDNWMTTPNSDNLVVIDTESDTFYKCQEIENPDQLPTFMVWLHHQNEKVEHKKRGLMSIERLIESHYNFNKEALEYLRRQFRSEKSKLYIDMLRKEKEEKQYTKNGIYTRSDAINTAGRLRKHLVYYNERVIDKGEQKNFENGFFEHSFLASRNLSDINFKNADLNRADIRSATFNNADLRHAVLAGTWLTGANFTNADLSYADFTRTCMMDVDLTGAKIHKTNFSEVARYEDDPEQSRDWLTVMEDLGCKIGNTPLDPAPYVIS